MDYYTVTYFHIFYIPDKYEAFANKWLDESWPKNFF